jgi:hypothetical protein
VKTRDQVGFILGKRRISGYPSPSRSIGMTELEENFELIYGAQWLRSKILSHKDLGPVG